MKDAAGQSLRYAEGIPTEGPLDLDSLSQGASGARRISRIAISNLGDPEARRIGQKAREIAGICQSFVEAMTANRKLPAGQFLRASNACRSGLIRFYESVLAEHLA